MRSSCFLFFRGVTYIAHYLVGVVKVWNSVWEKIMLTQFWLCSMIFFILLSALAVGRLHWVFFFLENFWTKTNLICVSRVHLKGFPAYNSTVRIRICFGGFEGNPFLVKLDLEVTSGRTFDKVWCCQCHMSQWLSLVQLNGLAHPLGYLQLFLAVVGLAKNGNFLAIFSSLLIIFPLSFSYTFTYQVFS